MCGIAGSVNFSFDNSRLNKDLYHRGPDEQTSWKYNNVEFYHFRLAILDISGGRQPMHWEHLTIIFNGEIYNHLDVRKKLQLNCTTNSDTETILQAYAKLGAACLQYFDGMFVFAIYDHQKQTLFLARDRAGKKPLYYYSKGDQFIFASELNALRNQLPLQIDQASILRYIRMGYFYKETTPYERVKELPAGSCAVINAIDSVPVIQKWWDIHHYYQQQSSDDFSTALEKVDAFLHEGVRNRVESSDLEVGSFLSGGIDSGLVTAIAKKYNNSLKTFTVSFEGEYDEAPLAKQVAQRYDTDHHEIKISFDHLVNDTEKILANYGEPFFDSSAIPSYYVSQAARKHLTVILNGDGGDEIFAGYRRYVPFAKYDCFNPGFITKQMAKLAYTILPVPDNKKSKYNFIYRLADIARKSGLNTYLSATIDSFEGYENSLFADAALLSTVTNDFDRVNKSSLTALQKIMNLDFDNILAGDLLVKMDIATMAHSLEGRSPLLCKTILEYVPSLPDSFKISGGKTKYLLRKLAEKYLPADLIYQPKRGFEIPLKKWIDGELKSMIADYLFSSSSVNKNYIKTSFLQDIWNRKINTGDEKRAKMIWTIFALEVWHKKCYYQ